MSKQKAYVSGVASYLPEKILTNTDLEKMVETSDEWITTRTGIKERHIARPDETASEMAEKAAKLCLERSKVDPLEIDLIIVGTFTGDYPCPTTSCLLQGKIGANNAAAFDLNAACSGYLYILSTAKAFIEAGIYRTILVVAVEKMSSVIDYTDRGTCVLFGDGAAASIVSRDPKSNSFLLEYTNMGSNGAAGMIINIPAGGSAMPSCKESVEQKLHTVRMQGQEVFKHAVRCMESAAQQCVDGAGITMEQIDWLIPHQANARIIEAIAKRSPLPPERIYNQVWRYGNTSGASVAIALDDLMKEQTLHSGERVLLVAFGAGLTWGSALLQKI